MVIEILVILGRDNAANADEDITAAPFLQFFHQGWKQCLVSCSQRGEANNMNIVIYSILGRFFRCLEQGTYVHVPAHVGKGGCQYLLASVMTVLTHLAEEDTGTAAFEFIEFFNQFLRLVKLAVILNSLEYTPDTVWMVAL